MGFSDISYERLTQRFVEDIVNLTEKNEWFAFKLSIGVFLLSLIPFFDAKEAYDSALLKLEKKFFSKLA